MFEIGELIDERYEVLGSLGSGGMAHVFRAHDNHLEREVALKVLRPHLTEADSERFRREIRALARLNHRGIVSIFDLGLGEAVYFAMELIRGGPMTDLGPYDPDPESVNQLLGAAMTVAEALGYVHRLGMVHRDLTPRNILLTELGTPKVMDFGLVQLTETSKALTRTGFTLGTPQYMAPEQATGDATGAATDLYAFGAVLYRAVTGAPAFDAENDQAVLYQHVYGQVVPPREVNPQVPRALEELILALLEKEPGKRPPSGSAVADALRGIRKAELSRAQGRASAGPGRSGVYPAGPPNGGNLKRRWTLSLDEGPQWPAGLSASSGFLLVGLRSDALAVVRPADGGVQAVFSLKDEASQPPLAHAGRLYLTSRDGSLQALEWPRGEVAWGQDDAGVVGITTLGDGLLLAQGEALTHLSKDGEERWHCPLQASAVIPPTVGHGLAFTATNDGWLHAARTTAGNHVFKVEVGQMTAPPATTNGVLLIPTREGELHAFDLAKRDVLWSFDLEGEQWSTPAVWREYVFAVSWGQRLHALSLKSGDDVWTQELRAPVTASPVVAGGNLYVATEAGELCVFDAGSGRELYRDLVANAAIQASPLPLDDGVIVAAIDGTVVAYG